MLHLDLQPASSIEFLEGRVVPFLDTFLIALRNKLVATYTEMSLENFSRMMNVYPQYAAALDALDPDMPIHATSLEQAVDTYTSIIELLLQA